MNDSSVILTKPSKNNAEILHRVLPPVVTTARMCWTGCISAVGKSVVYFYLSGDSVGFHLMKERAKQAE
jgi:hypothetical protein